MSYLYGYHVDDPVIIDEIPRLLPIKPDASARLRKQEDQERTQGYRRPMARELPFSLWGYAPVMPSTYDTATAYVGWHARVARAHCTPNRAMLRSLKRHVTEFVHRNFVPLSMDLDYSVETWLLSTNYNEGMRKNMLREYNRFLDGDVKWKDLMKVKGFAKEESYGASIKHARTINSRSDVYKTLVGPTYKLIEKHVFARPEFIKKIPGHERAQYILEHVRRDGTVYVCTDYTSFESSFTKKIMECVEMVLYRYMLKNHPDRKFILKLIKAQTVTNHIGYKGFKARISATRMSGEMNTSLGNGFTNLMLFDWMCKEQGIGYTGVVEGDDGLFSVSKVPDFSWTNAIGFAVKPEVHRSIGTASFCGQVFDEEECQLIRDPMKALIKIGWSTRQYVPASERTLMALARARALSMIYENPSCPILRNWCLKVLRQTGGVNIDRLVARIKDAWERERLTLAFEYYKARPVSTPEPGPNTRFLMEEMFSITVETQLAIEQIIDTWMGGRLVIPDFVIPDQYGWNQWFWENYESQFPIMDNPPVRRKAPSALLASLFDRSHDPMTWR